MIFKNKLTNLNYYLILTLAFKEFGISYKDMNKIFKSTVLSSDLIIDEIELQKRSDTDDYYSYFNEDSFSIFHYDTEKELYFPYIKYVTAFSDELNVTFTNVMQLMFGQGDELLADVIKKSTSNYIDIISKKQIKSENKKNIILVNKEVDEVEFINTKEHRKNDIVEKFTSKHIIFHITSTRGADAIGESTPTGFIVFKGSKISTTTVPSISKSLLSKRQQLINDGIIVLNGDILEFSTDYIFNSSSTAAAIILGKNANGRKEWKLDDGTLLKNFNPEDVVEIEFVNTSKDTDIEDVIENEPITAIIIEDKEIVIDTIIEESIVINDDIETDEEEGISVSGEVLELDETKEIEQVDPSDDRSVLYNNELAKMFLNKTGLRFETFYMKYRPKLIWYLTKYTKDQEKAADFADDAFIQGLIKIGNYDMERSKIHTWIYKIGENLVKKEYKDSKKMNVFSMDKENGNKLSFINLLPAHDEQEEVEHDQLIIKKANIIKETIQNLPDKYKKVMIMREIEKRHYQEIADLCIKDDEFHIINGKEELPSATEFLDIELENKGKEICHINFTSKDSSMKVDIEPGKIIKIDKEKVGIVSKVEIVANGEGGVYAKYRTTTNLSTIKSQISKGRQLIESLVRKKFKTLEDNGIY